jgi:hypothetical protein|tara:strand:+ start:1475 stop:1912 length:438 start_codon:yes stop_codon:yes gene_type:complete
MSTRANINIQFGESCIWLYSHYDGYLAFRGYDLISNLTHSKNAKEFLNRLLNQKEEPSLYRDGRHTYELTSEEHGDIEYLYTFIFTNYPDGSDVNLIVHQLEPFNRKERRLLLDTTIMGITPNEINEKCNLIVKEHSKMLGKQVA